MENKKECGNTLPCTCKSTDCERHGKCCECVAHHRAQGNLPRCLRPEK